MARSRELVPGNCYFLLNYYDGDLKVPFVSTYLFEREGEPDGERRMWLFREPASEVPDDDAEVENSRSESPLLTAIYEDQLYQMLDLQGLIASLGELVHLHPLHALPPPDPDSLEPRVDFAELEGIVRKVLELECQRWVTLTIQHTDDGFSLGRDAHGFYASFFPRVRLEAEHERRIRAVFADLGITPSEDYLTQDGRVRTLVYPLRADRELLCTVAGRLLLDVYRMRKADALEVTWSNPE